MQRAYTFKKYCFTRHLKNGIKKFKITPKDRKSLIKKISIHSSKLKNPALPAAIIKYRAHKMFVTFVNRNIFLLFVLTIANCEKFANLIKNFYSYQHSV